MKPIQLLWLALSLTTLPVLAVSTSSELKNQFNDPIQLSSERINYPQQHFAAKTEPVNMKVAPQLAATTQADPSGDKTVTQLLDLFALGYGLGVRGIYSGDYSGDSMPELILVNPNNVSVVEVKSGKFEPLSQINSIDNISQSSYFHNVATDSHYLFVSSTYRNTVQKLNLLTHQIDHKLTITNLSSVALTQTQGATQAELLIRTSDNKLHSFNPISMQLLRSYTGINADIVATGAFTAKDVSELLLSNGEIHRFNNGILVLQKTLASSLGNKNQPVDINNDGISELLSSDTWGTVRLIDPRQDLVLWAHHPQLDIAAITVADLDQDGTLDIIYGDGQWGDLHALKASNGEEFWSINNPNHGVTNIIVADLDHDGKQDIGWGSGYTSSGADNFYIHDIATKAEKWASESLDMPANAVALTDVDQNGTIDAIYATNSSESSYGPAIIRAYDTDSKTMLWSKVAAENNWGRTMAIATADLDRDGGKDIVIGASAIYTSLIRVIDAKNGSLRYDAQFGDGDTVTDLLIADLDVDGFEDILVVNKAVHTGSQGTYFTVLNGRTGAVKKTSPNLGFSWSGLSNLSLMDMADTAGPDVFALYSSQLYSYNYSSNTIRQINTAQPLQRLTVAIRQGEPTLFATTSDGVLHSVATDGSLTEETTLCSDAVIGINAGSAGRLIFNCSDSFGEYNLETGTMEFNQPTITTSGTPESLRFNNQDYYVVGGDKVGVYTSAAATILPTPAAVGLSTHVLKSVNGTLQVEGGADYYILEGQPLFGQFRFTDRKAGQFSYQPKGSLGQEKITYYAMKAGEQSPAAELKINLSNQAPIANDLTASTHWNKALTLTLPVKDDDEETLTYKLLSQPAQGTATLTGVTTGSVDYVPATTQLGQVSLSFSASDSLETSEIKNVVITLTNTTPVASPVNYSSSYTTPVNGSLKGEDPDGDSLTYELTSQPASGTITLDTNTGLFVYQPAGENDQKISFSYVVKDKFSQSAAQNVNISIKGKEKSGGGIGYGFIALLMLFGWRGFNQTGRLTTT
jgi:hypothetical protein